MQKRTDFFDNLLFNTVPDKPLVTRNKPHNNQLCADLSRFISAYPVVSHFLRFAWQTTALHPPILRSPQPLQKNDNPSPHTNPPKTALSLAFHNANIYIYLYAFTSALSHSLFVGERARPSRCTNPCHSHNHCKRKITPSLHTTPSKTALSLAPH